MDFDFTAEAGLAGLFLASFLSATLLPGGSEAVLAALLLAHPEQAPAALLLATVGNTAGGMVTYYMGRLIPQRVGAGDTAIKHLAVVRTHGAPMLLLAWVPIIGDALCAATGWLRLPPLACALWMALGKGARYQLVASGIGML